MNTDRLSGVTSLKSAIQELAPEQIRVIICEVTQAPPDIKLQACNDEKLKIPRALIVVPERLTDHWVPCYIEARTNFVCIHPYDASEAPEHKYRADKICLHNGLHVGEKVIVLVFGGGKIYLIMDRLPTDTEALESHHDECPGCDVPLPERELEDWMIYGEEE